MRTLATYNIKGGVGKTSAAVNLACLAAASGLRTLLWDLDPQGSATFLFRVKPRVRGGARTLIRERSSAEAALRGTDVEGLDLLPADFSYRHMDLVLGDLKRPTTRLSRVLEPLAGSYDLAVLDCPPSISLVSESVFEAADALLVPLIPATLSVRTFEQLLRFVEEQADVAPQVLAFFSMVDRRRRLHREMVEQLPLVHPEILPVSIPAATEVEQMGVARASLDQFARRSRAARAYRELWDEVARRTGLVPPA